MCMHGEEISLNPKLIPALMITNQICAILELNTYHVTHIKPYAACHKRQKEDPDCWEQAVDLDHLSNQALN